MASSTQPLSLPLTNDPRDTSPRFNTAKQDLYPDPYSTRWNPYATGPKLTLPSVASLETAMPFNHEYMSFSHAHSPWLVPATNPGVPRSHLPAPIPPRAGSDDEGLPDVHDLLKLPGYAAVHPHGHQVAHPRTQLPLETDRKPTLAEKTHKPKRKSIADGDDELQLPKRGRPHGAGNYTLDDIKALLDYTDAELPLGQRGWKVIYQQFSKWAQKHRRPQRTQKSLETKFKQLVKTTKPTGHGMCPPHIDRAHAIDELINERAGTRDLNDSDFANDEEEEDPGHISISSGDNIPPARAKVAVVRGIRDQAPVRRNARGVNGLDLVDKISRAFDPALQESRDSERTSRSLQSAQFFASAQQIRDAQTIIETLRTQITTLQGRIYEADRRRDLAELKLEMNFNSSLQTPRGQQQRSSVNRGRPKPKYRNEVFYKGGGGSVDWVTDNEATDNNDTLPKVANSRALKRTYAYQESPTLVAVLQPLPAITNMMGAPAAAPVSDSSAVKLGPDHGHGLEVQHGDENTRTI